MLSVMHTILGYTEREVWYLCGACDCEISHEGFIKVGRILIRHQIWIIEIENIK